MDAEQALQSSAWRVARPYYSHRVWVNGVRRRRGPCPAVLLEREKHSAASARRTEEWISVSSPASCEESKVVKHLRSS
ncbi:hypothetical protein AOLI_G00216950 [Acnodon oligacanthus]